MKKRKLFLHEKIDNLLNEDALTWLIAGAGIGAGLAPVISPLILTAVDGIASAYDRWQTEKKSKEFSKLLKQAGISSEEFENSGMYLTSSPNGYYLSTSRSKAPRGRRQSMENKNLCLSRKLPDIVRYIKIHLKSDHDRLSFAHNKRITGVSTNTPKGTNTSILYDN